MTPAAERYDFSEPPPGYEVGCAQDDEERLALVGSPLYSVRLDGITPWAWNEPTSPDLASCGDATTRAEAVAGAWAHHKARHDPPGMLMWVAALLAAQELPPDESGIRAAAWAWYERRLALVARLDAGIFCPRCGSQDAYVEDIDATTTDESGIRAAAWAWYERRLALVARLDAGIFCPRCGSQDAYVEDIDATTTTTQPWCTECDVEMGGLFDDVWPRILTWTDEQVAEVERWLVDSTAEMPEVLR